MSSIADAFERIEDWMRENGADAIVENLAPGATGAELAEAEARLGFALPAALRELWSVHDGQLAEHDGFYESYDLLSSSEAHRDQMDFFVAASASPPRALAESQLEAREIASKAWLVVAARDSDGVAINAESGRVFRIAHDDSPSLHLLAPSIEAWLVSYADAVTNDDYRVEEGFGEAYLQRRDRAQEARDEAYAAARDAEESRRASLSPVALMEQAVASKSESMADEALSRAKKPAERAAVANVLFSGDPAFVATTLRTKLRELTLTPAQWSVVAAGGEKLGNNAIVAYAKKMASS